MKICSWTFNGQEYSTEEQLDNYLLSQYRDTLENYDSVRFSKDLRDRNVEILDDANKIARARLKEDREEAIRQYRASLAESAQFATPDIIEVYNDKRTVSVLNYIKDQKYTSGFSIEDFRNYRKAQLLATKLRNMSPEDAELMAKQMVEDEINSWEYTRKIGKGLHYIAEKILNTNFGKHLKPSQYRDKINEMIRLEDRSDISLEGLSDDSIQAFIKDISNLKNRITKNDANAKIYSEYVIEQKLNPDLTLRGKIDFLVVHDDGSVEVIDLKVSTRAPEDYDKERNETIEHQLGFYRRMLNAKGISAQNISSSIIPVIISTPKDGVIDTLSVQSPIPISPGNKATYNINNSIDIKPEITSPIVKDVSEKMTKMFGITNLNGGFSAVTVDAIMKNKRKVGQYPDGRWYFSNDLNNQIESADSKEAIEMYVQRYLRSIQEATTGITLDLANSLNIALKSLNAVDVSDDSKKARKIDEAYNAAELVNFEPPQALRYNRDFLDRMFAKYKHQVGWEVIINSELSQLNCIALANQSTNEVDIISLSAYDLWSKVELEKSTNLMGKFYTERDTERSSHKMDSSIGNIELVKGLAVLNNIPQIKEGGFVIGDIRVFNIKDRKGHSIVNNDMLVKNYNQLSSNIGDKTNQLQFKSRYDKCYTLMMNAVTHSRLRFFKSFSENENYTGYNVEKMLKDRDDTMTKYDQLQELLKIQRMLREAPEFSGFRDAEMSGVSSNSLEADLYRELSLAILDLSNAFVDPFNAEKMGKWTGGWRDRSILNGTYTNTVDTVPLIGNLDLLWNKTKHEVVKRFNHYKELNGRWFRESGLKFGANTITNNFTGTYERFFDRSTEEAKLSFRLKNPDTDNTLNPDEKAFLREYLVKLNKVRYPGATEDFLADKMDTGEYYIVPLLLGNSTAAIVGRKGFKEKAKGVFVDPIREAMNPANELLGDNIEKTAEQEKGESIYDMIDIFALSNDPEVRAREIGNEDPFKKFEFNLERILDEYTLNRIRKEEYDGMLPIFNSAITTLKTATFLFGKPTDATIDFLNDYIKSSVLGRSLLSPEFKNFHKFAAGLKRITSTAVLGFNYRSGAKEMITSYLTLYNRAIANSLFDKEKIGIKDMTFAYNTVWRDAIRQTDPNKVTLLENMNFDYGMANMDMSELVDRRNFERAEFLKLGSKMYWFNRAPDFLHRMTILIGYMKKHGAYDAHKLVGDRMVYDWKLDKRFDLYAKDKTGKNYTGEERTKFEHQRALYEAMMQEFVDEGYKVAEDPNDENTKWRALTKSDELPRAYTTQQAKAIKQEADTLFGYMDNGTKSLYMKKGMFIYFSQFQTYITAKKNQWFLKRGLYGDGNIKHYKNEAGEYLYEKLNENTKEYELTTEVTDRPHYEWVGKPTEGILWSLVDLLGLTRIGQKDWYSHFKESWKDPIKKRNLIIGMHDLVWTALMMWLAKWLFGENKKDRTRMDNIGYKIFNNVSGDLNPVQTFGGAIDFKMPIFDFASNITNDIWQVCTGGLDILKLPYRQIGALRDWAPEPETKATTSSGQGGGGGAGTTF